MELLDALLKSRLNGTQGRIVLWVIRQTYGWQRRRTRFTWYRIAQDLRMDRPAVYRAGKALLQAKVLTYAQAQLAIQIDRERWSNLVGKRQNRCCRTTVDTFHRSVVSQQRERCWGTTLFPRAKDSSKDRTPAAVGAGFVDQHGQRRIYEGNNPQPTLAEQLMDHYIALRGKAYTKRQMAAFHGRFRKSAELLLDAYGGQLQDAKDAVTQVWVERFKTST